MVRFGMAYSYVWLAVMDYSLVFKTKILNLKRSRD